MLCFEDWLYEYGCKEWEDLDIRDEELFSETVENLYAEFIDRIEDSEFEERRDEQMLIEIGDNYE